MPDVAPGGTVTRVLFYDPAETDFAPVVKDLADYDRRARALETQRAVLRARGDVLSKRALARLKNLDTIGDLPFQALLLPDGGKRLQAVAAHLPFYDIDPAKVHMLGTGRWDTPGLGAEPALLGGWFAAPPLAAREEFQAQYAGVYGAAPPRLATLAYDAAALAAVLAQGDGARDEATGLPRPDFSHATLTDPAGYYGRDGVFRFLDDGTAERGLAVMEVGDHMNTVLSPAPETFTVN
ncbi:MAG: hypothetical protein KC645_01800 [Gemmatimonadetes bacterium]|nr:hypothetical protein [Gemmatimonadota bacterium]